MAFHVSLYMKRFCVASMLGGYFETIGPQSFLFVPHSPFLRTSFLFSSFSFPTFKFLFLFSLKIERKVLQRKDDWDTIKSASSREELQKNVVVRMKSVTGAKDDICISMLESNGYDLKTSIETFFNRR